MHTYKPAGGTWTTPVLVNGGADGTEDSNTWIETAADATGRIHLVRNYWDGQSGAQHYSTTYQTWTKDSGWGMPALVAYDALNAHIALDPSGKPHLVVDLDGRVARNLDPVGAVGEELAQRHQVGHGRRGDPVAEAFCRRAER